MLCLCDKGRQGQRENLSLLYLFLRENYPIPLKN